MPIPTTAADSLWLNTSRRLLSAIKPNFHAVELPALHLREGIWKNPIHHFGCGIGVPASFVVHQHDPQARMLERRRAQQIRRGLAREVTVVKSRRVTGRVTWKENFRAEIVLETGASGVLTCTQGAEEFIRRSGLSDVEDNGVSGLGVVENKVTGGAGGIALVVEVVAVDIRNQQLRRPPLKKITVDN